MYISANANIWISSGSVATYSFFSWPYVTFFCISSNFLLYTGHCRRYVAEVLDSLLLRSVGFCFSRRSNWSCGSLLLHVVRIVLWSVAFSLMVNPYSWDLIFTFKVWPIWVFSQGVHWALVTWQDSNSQLILSCSQQQLTSPLSFCQPSSYCCPWKLRHCVCGLRVSRGF